MIESKPMHASPFEHQATSILDESMKGITHIDVQWVKWSASLRNWIQYRQIL